MHDIATRKKNLIVFHAYLRKQERVRVNDFRILGFYFFSKETKHKESKRKERNIKAEINELEKNKNNRKIVGPTNRFKSWILEKINKQETKKQKQKLGTKPVVKYLWI